MASLEATVKFLTTCPKCGGAVLGCASALWHKPGWEEPMPIYVRSCTECEWVEPVLSQGILKKMHRAGLHA